MRPARSLLLLATVLLWAGCGASVVWYGHSPDRGRRVAVIEAGHRQRLTVDGEAQRPYAGIAIEGVVFSPDSRRLAYPARRRDGRWVVVLDGQEGRTWDGIGAVVFGPRGKSLAYLAQRGGRWHVVLDGRTVGRAWEIFSNTLRFSPDGSRLAWVERRGAGARAVVDGQPEPRHDAVAGLSFSPDGARLGYAARDGARWRVIVDGRPGPIHDHVSGPVFAADGRVAHVARQNGKARVVVDGVPGVAHREVRAATLTFTAAGELLYVAREHDGERVLHAGRPGPLFEQVVGPVLGPRRRQWGYIGRRGGQDSIVVNGRPGPTHARVEDLALGRDGRFACLVRSGPRMAVLHPGGRQVFDVVLAGSLVLSADGRHLAFLAGDRAKRELFIVIDGRRARDFDLQELNAAVLAGRRPSRDLLRRWVAAELAAALDASD